MTNSEQVVENWNASSVVEQLGKTLHQLKSYKDAFEDRVQSQWMEIEEHFRNLDAAFKRKFEELEAKEKEYLEKEAETHEMLVKTEAVVAAKEQDFLDRVQKLKDAAVAVISEARACCTPIMLESVDAVDNKDCKVSSSLGDTNSLDEGSPHKTVENAKCSAFSVMPRPELMQFCGQMDSRGLLNFTVENQKHLTALRRELSLALESAHEPARLVLDSLEGFYPPVATIQMDKKDSAALQGTRKSCIMFLEAMDAFMSKIDPGAHHLISPEIKQQAKAIADEWKPKLANTGIDATNGNSLEVGAFLQLLSTFRIASEFDEEELCKLVLVVAFRRQTPELCRSLGLTHKMPGVVESLIGSGKQIEAVNFIQAFQLAESFPPVPLLKAHLKEIRRNSQGKGANAGGEQVDVNAQELAGLKAVIRCVEEHKLEDDYPLDSLRRRVAQLAKFKFDKKRLGGDSNRHQQSKKPRANGGYRGFRGGAASGTAGSLLPPPVYTERTPYHGILERYPQSVPNPYEYQIPSQSAYGQPTTDQRMYYYPQDDRVPTGSYDTTPSNYSSYMVTGTRSSHQPYM